MDVVSLHRALKRLRVPRSWRDNVAVAAKSIHAPNERNARRNLASREVQVKHPAAIQQLNEQGWLSATDCFRTAADAAARRMERDFEFLRENNVLTRAVAGNKGDFFIPLRQNADFLDTSEVMALVTSRDLVDLVATYFGEVPVLTDICLRWSPVNDSARSSQLFHRDEEDATQLKFLLYVTEVTDASGPFTVLSAPASARVFAASGRRFGRFTDDAISAELGGEQPHALTGPRGTLTCIDTSRCLHFGSRCNAHERVALFFQYTRFLAPLSPSPDWGPGLHDLLPTLDPVQRRLFRVD